MIRAFYLQCLLFLAFFTLSLHATFEAPLIDKSSFIASALDTNCFVSVILRPPGFGKSTNLELLKHFLTMEDSENNKAIFEKMQIWSMENGIYQGHQGKYPVFFLSLKNVAGDTYQEWVLSFVKILQELCLKHESVIKKYNSLENSYLNELLNVDPKCESKISERTITKTIGYLTYVLYCHYRKNPFLLVDDFDEPIKNAVIKGYQKKADDFLDSLFIFFKHSNLEKAILVGTQSYSSGNCFSSSWQDYTAIFSGQRDSSFEDDFGFTQAQMDILKQKFGYSDQAMELFNEIHGSYFFNEQVLYNPRMAIAELSMLVSQNSVDLINNEEIIALIKKQDSNKILALCKSFELFLAMGTVRIAIDEHVGYHSLADSSQHFFSFLLLRGYLSAKESGGQDNLSQLSPTGAKSVLLLNNIFEEIQNSARRY